MTDISKVLAARDLVLQRNAALRSVSPQSLDVAKSARFDAKLAKALEVQTANSISPSVNTSNESIRSAYNAAVSSVNASMEQEDVATEAYERGDTTDIAAVVLNQQKASIQFEATLQIRNKLLAAYNDIMNMPL